MAKLFGDLSPDSAVFMQLVAKALAKNPESTEIVIDGYEKFPIVQIDENNYVVIDTTQELGQGALGIVYKSRHIVVDDQQVKLIPDDSCSPFGVVKISHFESLTGEEADEVIASYAHETKMLNKMQFTSIAKPITCDLLGCQRMILPMRRIEGRDLHESLPAEAFQKLTELEKEKRLMQIFYDVACQIQRGHQVNVVQSDVQRSNIVFNGDTGHAVLVDYQNAREISPQTSEAVIKSFDHATEDEEIQEYFEVLLEDFDDRSALRFDDKSRTIVTHSSADIFELSQVLNHLLFSAACKNEAFVRELDELITDLQADNLQQRMNATELVQRIESIAEKYHINLHQAPWHSAYDYQPQTLQPECRVALPVQSLLIERSQLELEQKRKASEDSANIDEKKLLNELQQTLISTLQQMEYAAEEADGSGLVAERARLLHDTIIRIRCAANINDLRLYLTGERGIHSSLKKEIQVCPLRQDVSKCFDGFEGLLPQWQAAEESVRQKIESYQQQEEEQDLFDSLFDGVETHLSKVPDPVQDKEADDEVEETLDPTIRPTIGLNKQS